MPDHSLDAPPATFTVSSETMGTCHIPDTFHDMLSRGVAALDFARVWNTRGTMQGYRMTAAELEAAAVQFEALARSCRAFAADAVKAGIRAESRERDSGVHWTHA